jgi:hypothetical protein
MDCVPAHLLLPGVQNPQGVAPSQTHPVWLMAGPVEGAGYEFMSATGSARCPADCIVLHS